MVFNILICISYMYLPNNEKKASSTTVMKVSLFLREVVRFILSLIPIFIALCHHARIGERRDAIFVLVLVVFSHRISAFIEVYCTQLRGP